MYNRFKSPIAEDAYSRRTVEAEVHERQSLSSGLGSFASTTATMPARFSDPSVSVASRSATTKRLESAPNVLVVCRIRPKLKQEANSRDGIEVIDEENLIVSNGAQRKQFAVDDIADSRDAQCTQETFFAKVGFNLARECLKGFNICTFAYGHTGSGKTYTMLGDGVKMAINIVGQGAGFMPRFLAMIFDSHQKQSIGKPQQRVRYTSQFYEVYNEQIRDLLCAGENPSSRQRAVRVHPQHGVLIEGICTSVVTTLQETLDLVNFGNQMRTVATTTMNERSSRSHAIFTFRFEQICGARASCDSGDGGSRCESTISFVDLAGREDQSASMNKNTLFREMCFINTSLFHLAHLITKLSERKIAPNSLSEFRNSKLTLLLAQALGGNSRTTLVATLSPSQNHFADSVSTLQFAQTVKKIQTKPVLNNKSTSNVVNELETELKKLRQELEEAKHGDDQKNFELDAAQAMIEYYKQSWEEAKSKSEMQGEVRKRMSVALGLASLEGMRIADDKDKLPPPFLTKLSDDPALQGCCNYMLNRRVLRLGESPDHDITLNGVGIKTNMCELRCASDGAVQVDILEEDSDGDTDGNSDGASSTSSSAEVPRVLINGVQIPSNTTSTLHHGDSLLLGYAHAFRLVVPTREMVAKAGGQKDPAFLARCSLSDLDSSSAIFQAVDEAGESFREQNDLHPSVKNMATRVLPDVMQTLHKSIRMAAPFIDEANEITKSVLGRNYDVKFQLFMLGTVFSADDERPELAVAVVHRQSVQGIKSPKSPSGANVSRLRSLLTGARRMSLVETLDAAFSEGPSPLLYLWSMEKFIQRLDVMREVFADGEDGDFSDVRRSLRSKPWLNPWREMSFADVKQQIELCEDAERPEHGVIDEAGLESTSTTKPQNNVSLSDLPRLLHEPPPQPSTCSMNATPHPLEQRTAWPTGGSVPLNGHCRGKILASTDRHKPDESAVRKCFIPGDGTIHTKTTKIDERTSCNGIQSASHQNTTHAAVSSNKLASLARALSPSMRSLGNDEARKNLLGMNDDITRSMESSEDKAQQLSSVEAMEIRQVHQRLEASLVDLVQKVQFLASTLGPRRISLFDFLDHLLKCIVALPPSAELLEL